MSELSNSETLSDQEHQHYSLTITRNANVTRDELIAAVDRLLELKATSDRKVVQVSALLTLGGN